MESEKFCLRWNDFERNISDAFKELRNDKDFFDVTLACDDEQLQAHKVILSACSPFFRSILRRNPHQHPLLYLKGVKYSDLQSVLSFMYQGEVNVAQEELNSFLAVAEELKVKGLTQNTADDKSNTRKHSHSPKPQPATKPDILKPVKQASSRNQLSSSSQLSSIEVPEDTNNYSEEIQEVTPVKSEPREPVPMAEPHYTSQPTQAITSAESSLTFHEESYEEYGYVEDQTYEEQASETSQGELAQLDAKIDSLLGSTDSGQLQCLMCGKTSNVRWNIRNHIETHVAKSGFNCDLCGKQYRTRNSLNVHKSKHHKTGQEKINFGH